MKRPLYVAGAAFGVLLASGSAWYGSSRERASLEPARISPEVRRSALPGRGGPEPPPLIRSIEVTRPAPIELAVLPSPSPARAEAELAPPVCDAPPRTLLRAGCPEAPPAVEPCAEEGKDCLYPTAGACVAQYQCLYGLWSPQGVHCPDAEQGEVLAGSGQCEANTPVPDAPCAEEGVSCGHRPCGIAGLTELVAECRCGRWYLRGQQCPLTR